MDDAPGACSSPAAGAVELNIALTYVGAVVMLLALRRMPLWAFHLALLAGTALITRAVYYSGDGVSYYGIWYLWVALFAFSFFGRIMRRRPRMADS
jgi:hypothetical protein